MEILLLTSYQEGPEGGSSLPQPPPLARVLYLPSPVGCLASCPLFPVCSDLTPHSVLTLLACKCSLWPAHVVSYNYSSARYFVSWRVSDCLAFCFPSVVCARSPPYGVTSPRKTRCTAHHPGSQPLGSAFTDIIANPICFFPAASALQSISSLVL